MLVERGLRALQPNRRELGGQGERQAGMRGAAALRQD
jgi:hypothetical protein